MGKSKTVWSYVGWISFILVVFLAGFLVYGVILHRTTFPDGYYSFIRTFLVVAWFLCALIIAIETVAMFFDPGATWITTLLAVCASAALSFSPEATDFYFPNGLSTTWIPRIFATLHFFFIVAASCYAYAFLIREHKLKVTAKEMNILVWPLIGCAVAYFPLTLIRMEFISFLGLFFFFVFFSGKLLVRLRFRETLSLATIVVYADMALLLGTAFTYTLATIPGSSYSAYGLSTISTFVVMFLYIVVYLNFIVKTTRKAYKTEEAERRAKTLQAAVLKEQIAPHFIFNSLQSVKTNYRISQDKGDRAIDLLSKHLRTYVKSGDKYIVPFVSELDSIMTFVELANLRTDHPYNVIYDIDVEDFEVPILSIEPLIENAILYSDVNNKEDGHIEISSFEEGDSIIIRVADNGKGFDVNAVREGAVGIKNAFERFHLLLGATCRIESELDKGTTITIAIPKGEPHENNRS